MSKGRPLPEPPAPQCGQRLAPIGNGPRHSGQCSTLMPLPHNLPLTSEVSPPLLPGDASLDYVGNAPRQRPVTRRSRNAELLGSDPSVTSRTHQRYAESAWRCEGSLTVADVSAVVSARTTEPSGRWTSRT